MKNQLNWVGSVAERDFTCTFKFKKGGLKMGGLGTFTDDSKKFTLEGEIANQ